MEEEVYIEFKNGQGPYLSDTQINQLQKSIKIDIKETKETLETEIEELQTNVEGEEVYSNTTGINTNFSLTKNLNEKERIRVYYCGRNSSIENDVECVKEIPVVNGEVNSSLEAFYCGTENCWLIRTAISITGTAVTLTNNLVNVIGPYPSNVNEASLYIKKIVAF